MRSSVCRSSHPLRVRGPFIVRVGTRTLDLMPPDRARKGGRRHGPLDRVMSPDLTEVSFVAVIRRRLDAPIGSSAEDRR